MVGELPGLLGFSIACQPCNPSSSLHAFLQCDTLQHSDRQGASCKTLVLEVQFPCWEAGGESFSHCYNPCFFHPPHPGTAVEDQIQPYSRARSWTESAERCDGRARWHRYDQSMGWNCSVAQCCEPCLVVRRKRGNVSTMVWRGDGVGTWCSLTVTSKSGGWQLPHLGDRAHLSQSPHGHTWMKLKAFSQVVPWVLSAPGSHLSAWTCETSGWK